MKNVFVDTTNYMDIFINKQFLLKHSTKVLYTFILVSPNVGCIPPSDVTESSHKTSPPKFRFSYSR